MDGSVCQPSSPVVALGAGSLLRLQAPVEVGAKRYPSLVALLIEGVELVHPLDVLEHKAEVGVGGRLHRALRNLYAIGKSSSCRSRHSGTSWQRVRSPRPIEVSAICAESRVDPWSLNIALARNLRA